MWIWEPVQPRNRCFKAKLSVHSAWVIVFPSCRGGLVLVDAALMARAGAGRQATCGDPGRETRGAPQTPHGR